MAGERIGVGVVGCGGFGRFALQHFVQDSRIELVGIGGTDEAGAAAAAQRFDVPDFGPPEALLERPEVELVYIATPPFLHHPQAMQALEAGKHVITEKPFALTLEQADEMIETARGRDLLVVANLMQRYNPLYRGVSGLVECGALGRPLHGYFENYAADEGLGPEHWFWDRQKSGGIFVEHGVHFFDMLEGWLGEGHLEAAQRCLRPGSEVEEQVQCTVRYPGEVLVNLYHGFHQPHRLDRQRLGLVFERGDVLLHEWIPVRAEVRGIAGEADTRRLTELFPKARLDVIERYPPPYRCCSGRGRSYEVSHRVELVAGEGAAKWQRYGRLVRALVRDQLAWIEDRTHQRTITEQNGRRSLEMALEADRMDGG